ncbi:putative holliday junction resolvase [Amphibacillus marinus]|uniref:Putative pre-16S rRNA nuclease n=1 Tax=Amphibacillus marinus TaxID=872970 RepID=A0A1H8NXE2_9BACI|nr:Holliday junction resolvase RuvX [Amphibacillus marinus]SEO34023.1 putative holliday junction resolvase [Amphibacillus marinus]
MKKMGLDVGSKTIGVAISDAFGWTAQGLKTIKWDEQLVASADDELAVIIKEHDISEIVVGLPKHMNGDIGERGEASKAYAAYLAKRFTIKTALWDERLSTMAAERVLLEADVSRSKRKKVIDKMAAVMILQGYLDAQQ